MGLAGAGYGAAMGLQDLLKQRFIEAIQRQKLAEEMRQADMANQVQQQRLGLDTQKLGEDTRQFNISSGQRDTQLGFEGQRVGMEQAMQPVRLRQMTAQTADVERKPQAEEAARTFTAGENEKNRSNAVRIAGIRSATVGASEPLVQALGPDGTTIYVPRSQAGGMQAPPKTAPRMQAGAAQLIAGADASLHQLDKLEQMLPKVQGSVGPLAGRASEMRQKIPGLSTDSQMAAFLAETATLKNATVKAITGAQMSEPEAKRIMAQVPTETDKPEVWVQKAKATRDNLTFMRDKMRQLYGQSDEGATPAAGGGRVYYDMNGNPIKK